MKNKTFKIKKFNALDLVIIIFLLALVAGVFFRTEIISWVSGGDTVDITVKFQTEPVTESTYYYFFEGDMIYTEDTDELLGTMGNITKTMAPVVVQLEDGTYVSDVNTERYVISGTLTVKGHLQNGVFSLPNGKILSAGDVFSAEGRQVTFTMKVIGVESAEQEKTADSDVETK